MEMSIVLAKILGVYMALFGVAMLINRDRMGAVLSDFENSAGLSTLSTSVSLILGLVLVNMHNVLVYDWHVVITIIAYLILVSAVLELFFTKQMAGFRKAMHAKGHCTTKAVICLGVGVFLLYHGYYLGA